MDPRGFPTTLPEFQRVQKSIQRRLDPPGNMSGNEPDRQGLDVGVHVGGISGQVARKEDQDGEDEAGTRQHANEHHCAVSRVLQRKIVRVVTDLIAGQVQFSFC
jgi:hypothetical protein